jgi:predicted NAD/FAD-binding protein
MKIAIIGSGIAGNVVAYKLHKEHDITVFEANDYIGGHTHTHNIQLQDKTYAVDTGFIVYNEWTYPNFIQLLNELNVEVQPSNMSFSVKCAKTGLEYNGTTLNTLFAQRKNCLRPSFYRMIKDILRFNEEALAFLKTSHQTISLGEYLSCNGYSNEFIQHYIVPMGAAIWSTEPKAMFEFPARFFIRFFSNHGMLSVNNRPLWNVVKNGSNSYVDKMVHGYRDRIRLNTPIQSIRRSENYVEITPVKGQSETFDSVFIACHSDQALKMLQDPSMGEKEVLSALPYQRNEVVLHTDTSVLPKKRLAWAAWNYHILEQETGRVAVTYNMNILQSINAPETFCVTLNNTAAIDPDKIIKRLQYDHPLFTAAGIAAQKRQKDINGANRTYYCGAYWRNGFHEDGVVSALNALTHFKETSNYEQLHLRRAS